MLEYIKKRLFEDISSIIQLLEYYGYTNFNNRNAKYLTFGRDENSSATSLVLYKKNNEALFITDYPRILRCDIFKLIEQEKGASFGEVVSKAKEILGISHDFYYKNEKVIKPFGGLFSKKRIKNETLHILDNSVLDNYEKVCNTRFLKDGISLCVQRLFEIGYSVQDEAITIPIHSETGDLVGVKARINRVPNENESKYYYLHSVTMSNVLYGYSQNYQYLFNEAVVVFESEKSVLQCATFGFRKAVAIGSSSLSKKQAILLLSLSPQKVIFAMDKGLSYEVIKRNMIMLKSHLRMKEVEIGYLDMNENDIKDKASPSDMGQDKFEELMMFNYTEFKG